MGSVHSFGRSGSSANRLLHEAHFNTGVVVVGKGSAHDWMAANRRGGAESTLSESYEG
jgi:hypothetical protein